MGRDVDAHYYGFRDDDDGKLVPMELAAEKEAIARLIAEYKGSKEEAEENEEEALKEAMEEGKEARFMARVKVPTQKDIEEALIRRKKQELLEMYAIDSDDLDQLEKQAK